MKSLKNSLQPGKVSPSIEYNNHVTYLMVRSTTPDKRKWCESHWNHARTYYTRYRILDTNLTIAEGHLSETCKEALVIHHIFDANSPTLFWIFNLKLDSLSCIMLEKHEVVFLRRPLNLDSRFYVTISRRKHSNYVRVYQFSGPSSSLLSKPVPERCL